MSTEGSGRGTALALGAVLLLLIGGGSGVWWFMQDSKAREKPRVNPVRIGYIYDGDSTTIRVELDEKQRMTLSAYTSIQVVIPSFGMDVTFDLKEPAVRRKVLKRNWQTPVDELHFEVFGLDEAGTRHELFRQNPGK